MAENNKKIKNDGRLNNCVFFNCSVDFNNDELRKNAILLEYYGIIDPEVGKGAVDFIIDYAYRNYPRELSRFLNSSENIKKYHLGQKGNQSHIEFDDFNVGNPNKEYTPYERYTMAYMAMEVIGVRAGIISPERMHDIQNEQKRKQFIMNTAIEHADDLRAIGFDEKQIETAKSEGTLPKEYNVHHKFHRYHLLDMEVDYNAPENLVIMRYDEKSKSNEFEHNRIHNFVNNEKRLKEHSGNVGKSMNLDLIWVPGSVYNPNKELTPEEVKKQTEIEMRAVFKPKDETEQKKVDKIVSSMRMAPTALYAQWWQRCGRPR